MSEVVKLPHVAAALPQLIGAYEAPFTFESVIQAESVASYSGYFRLTVFPLVRFPFVSSIRFSSSIRKPE